MNPTKRLWATIRVQSLRLLVSSAADKTFRELTGRPSYRFGWVTPSILLGGQPARAVWPRLMRRGITGVVNLRQEYDYKAGLGALPLHYLYLPTPDNTAPSQEHLWLGVRFIEQELASGGKVYVHCWEGLGRSPTLVAAYLVNNGMEPADAWAAITRVRPFIRPNPLQRARLEEFAAAVKAIPGGAGTETSPAPTPPSVQPQSET